MDIYSEKKEKLWVDRSEKRLMTEVEKKRLNYLSHIGWRTIDNEIWKKTVNLVKNPPSQTPNKFGQAETADDPVA